MNPFICFTLSILQMRSVDLRSIHRHSVRSNQFMIILELDKFWHIKEEFIFYHSNTNCSGDLNYGNIWILNFNWSSFQISSNFVISWNVIVNNDPNLDLIFSHKRGSIALNNWNKNCISLSQTIYQGVHITYCYICIDHIDTRVFHHSIFIAQF